ncbi:hypothetical protein JW948_00175 [bacterium]|nr:hypothetical protein [bacterium]
MKFKSVSLLFFIGSACLLAGGFSTLKMGSDARTSGMGLSGTALLNGASSSYWNPAMAAGIQGRDVTLSVHKWMDDIQSEFVGVVAGNGIQGAGFYLLFTEIPGLEHRLIASETPLGSFSSYEMCAGLTYARKVVETIRIGFSVKTYYDKIFTDDTWGLGGDLGVFWQMPLWHLQMGGVLQNFGSTGRLNRETVPLPLTGKLGWLLPLESFGGQWLLQADAVKEEGFPFHIHSGAELTWHSVLSIRGGYQTGYDIRDITAGAGLLLGNLRLDYAYMPMTSLGDSHRLSMGLNW